MKKLLVAGLLVAGLMAANAQITRGNTVTKYCGGLVDVSIAGSGAVGNPVYSYTLTVINKSKGSVLVSASFKPSENAAKWTGLMPDRSFTLTQGNQKGFSLGKYDTGVKAGAMNHLPAHATMEKDVQLTCAVS